MLIVPRKRIWTQQPQYPAQIDWSNPIAAKFSAIAIPNGAGVICLTRGISDRFATYGGPLVKNTIGPNGIGVDGSARTSQSVRLNSVGRTTNGALNNVWDAPTSAATWIVLCERFGDNPNGNSPIFGNASAGSSPYAAWSILDSGGSGGFQVECSAGGSYRSLTAGTIPNGVPLVLAGRYDGTKLEAFTNGVKYPSSTAGTGSLVYPGNEAYLGGPAVGNFFDYAANGRSFNGLVYLALLSPFALTDTEIARISGNPWQIFRAPDSRIFVPTGAGAGSGTATSISSTTDNATGSINSRATSRSAISATLASTVGSVASRATAKTSIAATTATPVGNVTSKATCKSSVSTATSSAVGSIASSNAGVCATGVSATTASVTGAIVSKTTSKTAIAATSASTTGAISSASVYGVTTEISATLVGVFGSITSTSGTFSGSISDADIARIAAAVFAELQSAGLLTVPKFLALK